MKLKKLYSSREVAAITGLSARQLQWWDQRRIFTSSIPSHKTERGGYTERRYTPIDLLELMVLADLRRRGFTVPRLRRLLGRKGAGTGARASPGTVWQSTLDHGRCVPVMPPPSAR